MKERQRDRRLKSAGLPFNMIVHDTEPNMTKMSFYQPLHGRVTEETQAYEEDSYSPDLQIAPEVNIGSYVNSL